MSRSSVVAELTRLAERRHRDPAAVRERADALVAAFDDDPAVRACGHWVLGLALHELGEPREAIGHYRRAVVAARAGDDADTLAVAQASMAISLLTVGRAGGAERAIRLARRTVGDEARGVVEALAGLVQQRTGRLEDALTTYRQALPLLTRRGDDATIARLLLNRGILHGYRGELAAALEDLREAERLAVRLDLPVLTAMAAHNSGFVQGRRGDVPDALAAFDRAGQAYRTLGDPPRQVAVLHADRCEVLLEAGLASEARKAAERAVAGSDAAGDVTHRTESRLLLARALLAEGDHDRAMAEANSAARSFKRLGSPAWAALARYVGVQAEVAAGEDKLAPPTALLERCRTIAAELEGQGWQFEALHVRTFVGRVALALDRPDIARAELAPTVAARTRGTAAARARAWHATALHRLAVGRRGSARRALEQGMRVVDEYRSTLGGTELRAQAATHGVDLARLGLRLALDDGDGRGVLEWAERCRAGALRRPPVHPPEDDRLAEDLAELRRWHTELSEAPLAGADPGPAVATIARLEESVRQRTRQLKDRAVGDDGPCVDDIAGTVGARTLVEYVALEGTLYAVCVQGGRFLLLSLAPVAAVEDEVRYLRFALRGALPPGPPWAAADAARGVAAAAGALDRLLVAPLGLDTGEVVIVPTGALHGLPWGALPGLATRSVTIAPSAGLWTDGRRRSRQPRGRVVLATGPGVPGGTEEVAALRNVYPDARALAGAAATAPAVLDALADADLAHLAAHGTFRADSPLFSSLLLADGPLTVYDLERLRAVPDTFVLPACDAATAAVRSGDELLGTAAALLHLGVRSVIAPVMAVPDLATTALMLDVHRWLCEGAEPAAALALATADARHRGGPLDLVVAACFVCIGADRNDPSAGGGERRIAP